MKIAGSCTCMTKTPVVQYHADDCGYRAVLRNHLISSEVEDYMISAQSNLNYALNEVHADHLTEKNIRLEALLSKAMASLEEAFAILENTDEV